MRLLKILEGGALELTKDLEEDEVPPYVILSHTWGKDEGEVTFKDLMEEQGKDKAGYQKLQFCRDRAAEDGEEYFWVDTCCIDKTNLVELTTAITSMFRWYAKAERCFVLVSDVSYSDSSRAAWESEFRNSRWFTRGWTLQELLAPEKVEFYDVSGTYLGTKDTLQHLIRDITGIPASALQGRALSSFSVDERLSWKRTRKTKKAEDEAYSLLGICSVSMVPIYGEGREAAMTRLRKEIKAATKGPRPQDFSIPFSETEVIGVQHFVARERELSDIHTALSSDGSRRAVVLHGLGGIGKTQTAVAYARRHKDDYSAIFWLNIRDETSVKRSFANIAKRIVRYHPTARFVSSANPESVDGVVEAVKAWLSEIDNTRWLAIYDNYDNPQVPGNTDPDRVDIRQYLPDAYQGSVIVTTRSSRVRLGPNDIEMCKLTDIRECVEILSTMSRRDLSADDPDVLKLARKFDGLPLALATAGAYLDQVTISIADYLGLYESSWSRLHQDDPGLESYEDRTLYTTWNITYNHLYYQNEDTSRLLGLWCYFSNEDFWFELLRERVTFSLHDFTEAMRLLRSYGLVDVSKAWEDGFESSGYSIHACVHSWTIHVLNEPWRDEFARLALMAIAYHMPEQDGPKSWLTQRRLLPHADRCLQYVATTTGISRAADRDSFYYLGHLYVDQGRLATAETMFLWALEGYEEVLGTEHEETLRAVNSLALLHMYQGKLAAAEAEYTRALDGFEKVLGPDHKATLDPVNNLGMLYHKQGKLAASEVMYRRALDGHEKLFGPEAIEPLNVVHNLGYLFETKGDYQAAEAMYVRALAGREKALGAEHTTTLDTVINLGVIHKRQGKLAEAEAMYLRAVEGYTRAYGEEHTSTLGAINNLAIIYSNEGKLAEAEEMYERVLTGVKKAVGEEHTMTYNTYANLAVLYRKQGRFPEAAAMYERVIAGYTKVFGAEHTSTLENVVNLGILQQWQHQPSEAKRLFEQALEGYHKVEGSHDATIQKLRRWITDIERDQVKMGPLPPARDKSASAKSASDPTEVTPAVAKLTISDKGS